MLQDEESASRLRSIRASACWREQGQKENHEEVHEQDRPAIAVSRPLRKCADEAGNTARGEETSKSREGSSLCGVEAQRLDEQAGSPSGLGRGSRLGDEPP